MTIKCPHCGGAVPVVLPDGAYMDAAVEAECPTCKQPLKVRVTVIRMGYAPGPSEIKESKHGTT